MVLHNKIAYITNVDSEQSAKDEELTFLTFIKHKNVEKCVMK